MTRLGCEVVVAEGAGCCGALTHHMGRAAEAHGAAAANIRAWMAEKRAGGLDAIVINTSGCGTTVKDYGHMFRLTALAGEAAEVAMLACDISELLVRLAPEGRAPRPLRIAYHAACSLQHGQQVKAAPKDLLRSMGFEVTEARRQPSVLRIGWNLQPASARPVGGAETPQGGDTAGAAPRRDRGGQYRLHDADRIGNRDPGRSYGGTDRLGDGGPEPRALAGTRPVAAD